MAKELALREEFPAFANPNFGVETQLAQYSSDQFAEFLREGANHLLVQRIQAAKAVAALDLTTLMYGHILPVADGFKRRSYGCLAAAGRDEACQAAFEHLFDSLQALYDSHVLGIVEVGATAIARKLHRPIVLPPPPEKPGFFKRLFG